LSPGIRGGCTGCPPVRRDGAGRLQCNAPACRPERPGASPGPVSCAGFEHGGKPPGRASGDIHLWPLGRPLGRALCHAGVCDDGDVAVSSHFKGTHDHSGVTEMSIRRIALVNQPWGQVAPPVTTGGSIPLVLYELARRLMEYGDQVSYYTRSRFRPYTVFDNGITFRYQPVVADHLVQKLRNRLPLPRSQTPTRPRWASDWSYCTF